MSFNISKIKTEIEKIIDKHEETKEFNKTIKKIFNLNSMLEIILFRFAMRNMLIYEEEISKTQGKEYTVLSNTIKSTSIKNGKEIYDYNFTSDGISNKGDTDGDIVNIYFELIRKDKAKNYYEHHIKNHLQIMNEIIEKSKDNIEKELIKTLEEYINIIYEYANHYINEVKTIDEEFFIKEIIYILADADSNKIYEDFLNDYNSK